MNQKVTPEYLEMLRTLPELELRKLKSPWPDTYEDMREVWIRDS